jgi:putative glutamine amidotransferase
MNKIIGIPGYKGTDSNNFGVGNNYLNFFQKNGYNPRIIMPWEEYVKVDMLLLPGGMDVSPTNYNQIPEFGCGNQDVFKEFFFKERLPHYVEKNIPILGICLGMQQLASYFGSELIQDLIYHKQSSKRWETAHNVFYANDTTLSGIFPNKVNSKNGFEVNSHHHQGVTVECLSDALEPLLICELEGIDTRKGKILVEAFKHKTLPIYGVQWHPEELYDNFTINLISELTNIKSYANFN